MIRTNGINMYYEQQGEGPPLLLLMGLGAPAARWEEHVKCYARYFRCILVDNRGVGRSDQPLGPYTTAMMADDIAGLINELGVDSVHLSGISMGGAIAQELALRHPRLVRSLILNCTWPRCDTYMRRMFSLLRALVSTDLPPEEFVRFIFLLIFTPAYHTENLADLERRQEETLSYAHPQSAEAFAAQCNACISHDSL